MAADRFIRVTTPDGQVRDYTVDFETAIVGRADGNRIVIPHVSVSRRHAHFLVENGVLMLEDFSSATGTFVGDRRLAAGERVALGPGSLIRFGEATAEYVVEVEPVFEMPPEAPVAPVAPFAEASAPEERPTPEVPPPMARETVIDSSKPEPRAPAATNPFATPNVVPVSPPPPAPREPEQSAALAAQDDAFRRQWLGISLVSPGAPIAPGSAAAATVTIQNRGTVADEAVITVEDIPPRWVEIARPRIPLMPGARAELTIVFRIPPGSDSQAGVHRFTVVARSTEHAIEVRSIGEFSVTAVERLVATIHPPRATGAFTITVVNSGNVAAPILLQGTDDDESLTFKMPEETMVAPGATVAIPVVVKPRKRRLLGKEYSSPFGILVRSAESTQPAVRLDATRLTRPPLQVWRLPLALLLLTAGVGSGAYGVVTLCRRDTGVCADLKDQFGGGSKSEPTPTATAVPSVEPAIANCGSVRLKTGGDAIVINSGASELRVRADGALASAVVDRVGDNLRVKLGDFKIDPNAGAPLIFWKVSYGEKSGWIAEFDPPTKLFLLSPAAN